MCDGTERGAGTTRGSSRGTRVAAVRRFQEDVIHAHAVAHLARTHLSATNLIRHVPNIGAGEFHEQVARYGGGIDHLAGEVPLAVVKAKLDAQAARARDYSVAYIVTDRRLFGRAHAANIPHQLVEVGYAGVTGAPGRSGTIAPAVTVQLGAQSRKLYVAPKQLQSFFVALATLPPPHRTFGPPQPPARGPQDPSGAWAASQAVATPDPRTWAPLQALFARVRQSEVMPDEAAALVPSLTRLARAVAFGREGAPQGGWRTPLPRSVLGHALHRVLGPATAVAPARDGEVHDFHVGARSGTGSAVASTVVGLASLATLGVGWVSTSTRQALTMARVHVVDTPQGTTFHLSGNGGAGWLPLSMHWWRVVDAIHQALFRIEARYLLGRVLLGPRPAPQELIGIERGELETRVARYLGPTMLEEF